MKILYDIFGSPVAGDFTTGTDYGYLGKPYDSITGLYNYGYRDYSPQSVRFTEYKYSQDGRSVEVVEGGLYTATYRLDAWGNVVETTDSEGNMWVATSDINKIYTYETNKKNK
jgi:RHS repeat-associated protein